MLLASGRIAVEGNKVRILNREKWIDNAKGIAMILVIAGHAGGGLGG